MRVPELDTSNWVLRDMQSRRTAKLASWSEPDLLGALAEGLRLLAEHTAALDSAAGSLTGAQAVRGARALQTIADEEAAKYLILIDVARCARRPQADKSRQLKRFHNHLAKGIYARSADWSVSRFGELIGRVDDLRQSHYLDGPNDVDWIFRNEVEAEREDSLYVDFVETDVGSDWRSPALFDHVAISTSSRVVQLVGAMDRAGFTTTAGLSIVAEVWNGFLPDAPVRWEELRARILDTLTRGTADGLTVAPADAATIVDSWTFPLHHVTLDHVNVALDDLRRRQAEWTPD